MILAIHAVKRKNSKITDEECAQYLSTCARILHSNDIETMFCRVQLKYLTV